MAANPSEVVSSSSQDGKLNKEKAEAQTQQEYKKIIKKLKGALRVDELSAFEYKGLYELNQFLGTFRPEIVRLVGVYLDDRALNASVKMFLPLLTCTQDIKEREQVKEILPHIFNANPEGIESLFNKKEGAPHSNILLKKASYDEGYFSKKLNKFFCFRHWQGVSPLQAAYLCGDGPFLGRKLLAYIRDNSLTDVAKRLLLKEAKEQLQELLNRGVNVEKTSANNTTVAVSAAATEVNNNSTVDNKKKAELCHGVSENTENKFADGAEFLAPIQELINAYNAWLSLYDSRVSQWTESNKLWEQVGECQKRLSQYVKQEFFGPIPFDPTPLFDTEPSRGECRYWNDERLDLDELGIDTSWCGLYKVERAGAVVASPQGAGCVCIWSTGIRIDLAAVSRLSELRETDLRDTIHYLKTLESESVRTLIADIAAPRFEP